MSILHTALLKSIFYEETPCLNKDHYNYRESHPRCFSGALYKSSLQTFLPTGDFSSSSVSQMDSKFAQEHFPELERMIEMPMSQFKGVTEAYGFQYGPAFSVIKRVWRQENHGLCLIDTGSDKDIVQELGMYVIHPVVIDACLQSCFIPLGDTGPVDKSIVPVGFKRISLLHRPRCNQYFCHVTMKADTFGLFDVVLMNPRGNILLTMSDFKVAELTSSVRSSSFDDVAYEVDWMETPLTLSNAKSDRKFVCVVLKDSSSFSNTFVKELESCTTHMVNIELPPAGEFDEKAQETVTAAIYDLLPVETETTSIQVINLWPLETNLLPQEFDVIDRAQDLSFHSSVFLMQLLLKAELSLARLVLLTRGTQFVDGVTSVLGCVPIPWSASVWGFRRTAQLEELNLEVVAVDLSVDDDLRESKLLKEEILCTSSEDNEVVYRNGKRFINRLSRMRNVTKLTDKEQQPMTNTRSSFALAVHPITKSFCLRKQTACKLSDKEVEVEVLVAWNMLESLHEIIKGSDCTFFFGRVTKVLEISEHKLQIGEDICGVVSSRRFGKHVLVGVQQIFPRPITMTTDEQAATLPACLSIAHHTIAKLAAGRQEQKVLIHEANKGPGLAAVLVARAYGHRVICTSSADDFTSSKKMLLGMGAEQVLNASCLDLTQKVCGSIDGAVFFYHPLPNAVQKSSHVLKQGGKLMFLNASHGGDVVLRTDECIAYERMDVASVFMTPGKFQELFSSSLRLLEGMGKLDNLLRLDQRSIEVINVMHSQNHFGRESDDETQRPSTVSLTSLSFGSLQPKTSGLEVLAPGLDEHGLKPNRTYVVVGGVRGFGFEVGRWMAENGAKTVVLVARSPPSDAKRQELSEMERKTGAKMLTIQVCEASKSRKVTTRSFLSSVSS